MEMDVEEYNTRNTNNTSEQNNASHTKSGNNTDKLLKENNALTKETNVLLHTLIMQNKTNIEYRDSIKHDTKHSIDQHAKEAQVTFDNLYKSHNAQLKNKALHIPMTGATVPTTAQTTKSSNTEDSII
jgi:hypothetical protein